MVIVDTSIWLQFFRLQPSSVKKEMDRLRASGEIAVVGVVLAEVLQGARTEREAEQLRAGLRGFPYLEETQGTWVRVGELSHQLRQKGVTVSIMDLLIAALALEHGCEVYTLDEHFERVPGLTLHTVRG
ncbi:MAG: PIN domain-containing protein [Dehalococcoidia bacterium]|nr:PIN domain-containing protein [Dehalococcoidia bacterium]